MSISAFLCYSEPVYQIISIILICNQFSYFWGKGHIPHLTLLKMYDYLEDLVKIDIIFIHITLL